MNIKEFLETELQDKAFENFRNHLSRTDFYSDELNHRAEFIIEDLRDTFFNLGVVGIPEIYITTDYRDEVVFRGDLEVSRRPTYYARKEWRDHLIATYKDDDESINKYLKSYEANYIGEKFLSEEQQNILDELNDNHPFDVKFSVDGIEVEYDYNCNTTAVEALNILLSLAPDEYKPDVIKMFELEFLLDEIDYDTAREHEDEIWVIQEKFLEDFLGQISENINSELSAFSNKMLSSYEREKEYILSDTHIKDLIESEDYYVESTLFDEHGEIIE